MKLNSLKSAGLGKLNAVTPVCIKKAVTADATGGLVIDVPFSFEISHVVVQSDATVSNATAKLTDGTNDITNAVVCATLDGCIYNATIDVTYRNVSKGGVLKVVTANAADRATLYIYGVRT